MRQAWGEFLASAKPRSHGAQVYADPAELVASVAAFAAAGLEQEEPIVLVATREHAELFSGALADAGRDPAAAQAEGLLVVADAESTLDAIVEGAGPSPDRFDAVVGGLLDTVERPGRRSRVFGEMVDLLVRRGDLEGAIELERLWNALAERRDFSLLCGYSLDVFDFTAQAEALPAVCRAHSHVLPARNYPRFAGAVDEALRDVLGPAEAAGVYVRVSREADAAASSHIPLAQLLLMWVSENLPGQSERILEAARLHYAGAA